MDILRLALPFFEEICDFTINSYRLDNLVGRYCGDYSFQLKDKRVQLTVSDVGHILGIPNTRQKVDVSKKGDASFWPIHFGIVFLKFQKFHGMLFSKNLNRK